MFLTNINHLLENVIIAKCNRILQAYFRMKIFQIKPFFIIELRKEIIVTFNVILRVFFLSQHC